MNANGRTRAQAASEIQVLFRRSAPQVDGYELQGISFPCEIGGITTILFSEKTAEWSAPGDVSGKGTGCALSWLHAAARKGRHARHLRRPSAPSTNTWLLAFPKPVVTLSTRNLT
jgi:hypothetical protein